MSPREEMEAVLKKLEDEYRFWMVEAVKMGRGIELMEDEIQGHDLELGMDRAADLNRRLAYVRDQHHQIEERILAIRHKLDELRERLKSMPASGGNEPTS
jgi:plasmid stabilization system protein ParE